MAQPHDWIRFPQCQGQIHGDVTNGIGWISLSDVATFTVTSLDNPAAENAVIELGDQP